MKSSKTVDFFCRLTTWAVAIFPLALAVICATPNFFGGWGLVWENHGYGFYFLPDIKGHLIGGVLLAAAWVAFFVWFCRRQLRDNAAHLPLKIFLLTLISRGIIALTIGQFVSPISDFEFAWNRACTGVIDPQYTSHLLSPPWMNFSMFERCWVLLAGTNMGLGLVFACVLFDSITATMIFLFSDHVFNRRIMALVASCLYVFYPSAIVFTLTPSSEHMGIACFMTMAALLARCTSEKNSRKRLFLFAAAAGVAAGMGNSVKQILVLYATATVIVIFAAMSSKESRTLRNVRTILSAIVIFGALEIGVDKAIGLCSEKMFNISYPDLSTLPHGFCVGLNRQGEGQIHVGELSRTWHKLIAAGKSPEEAKRTTYDVVIKDWQAHPNDVLPFFAKKFAWTWQDDNRPFGMAMLHLGKKMGTKVLDKNDQEAMAKTIAQRELGVKDEGTNTAAGSSPSSKAKILDSVWQSMETAGFVIYFTAMLLAAIGTVWYGRRAKGNLVYAWACLIVFGFWGIMVLSEASSRYKCLIMPYVFILMAPFVSLLITGRGNAAHNSKDNPPEAL